MNNDEIKTFFSLRANIVGNDALREPQIGAYLGVVDHFQSSFESCYVQLPVGCGKTGLMGITPFGVSEGRVLVIAPNLTVRTTIYNELNISNPDCFYARRNVLDISKGPFISELKTSANIHDCDSAHIVLANIQQFAGESNKWYERLSPDYFKMILVDEGHHNVADTWTRLFQYFSLAKIVSYTATPMRADGQQVLGKKVYTYSYARSMIMGFISPVDLIYVSPKTLTFTMENTKHEYTIDQVLQMRENDWFSKGVALSEECNRNIVQASIRQLAEVRKHGSPRQIIACACSIRHANQISAIYHEYGLKSEVLHSKLKDEEKERIEAALRTGLVDVVVQVQMLGEGYDLKSLSVAAIFRPYRSLAPYIQFIGRILRLANPSSPSSISNRVYVVSHMGLNDERWWTDFTNFDKEDRKFMSEFLSSSKEEVVEGHGPRLTLRPFMKVLNETIEKYIQRGFLKEIDAELVSEMLATIREKGFDPLEFGLTEEVITARLKMAAQGDIEQKPFSVPVQPQKKKEALRVLAQKETRSIADVVLNRLQLDHGGRNLIKHFPGRGEGNSAILVTLASAYQNKIMGIESGKRNEASLDQFQKAVDASADIADGLTRIVREKVEGRSESGEGQGVSKKS